MHHLSEAPGIFNDVIGPVMRGPSSSHTAGAYRIAVVAASLYGHLPAKVKCTFDPEGSFAPTYRPLGVDKAICSGLIGLDMLGSDYERSMEIAESLVQVQFTIEGLGPDQHPNTIRIEMSGKENLTLWARSTGGGSIEIFRLNDWDVCISGKHFEYFIEAEMNSPCEFYLKEFLETALFHKKIQLQFNYNKNSTFVKYKKCFVNDNVKIFSNQNEKLFFQKLESLSGFRSLRFVKPVFDVQKGLPLFRSAAELASHAKKDRLSLGEWGIAYETRYLGITRREALDNMADRFAVMCRSIDTGLMDREVKLDLLTPHASTIMSNFEANKLPFGGRTTLAAIRAMAVMHTCNSRGVVCAAPTGGSAGVLPGVVTTLAGEMGLGDEDIARCLFAAGVIGLIVANRATFAAEVAGCQVEIGVAGAMAAAAAVEAAGGCAMEALDAASISLQNTIGSICDPVGGGCEIPCHTRNGAAAAAAFTCADLIMGGYPNPIPLDDAIDASFAVGRLLPAEFRCTAKGGIAVTPSAMELVRVKGLKATEPPPSSISVEDPGSWLGVNHDG